MAPNTKRNAAVQEIFADPIFFHKSQVSVGSRLRYFGRTNPNSEWRVVAIQSYRRVNKTWRMHHVEQVAHLGDDVIVVNQATWEQRTISFSYMSYSAIWRLSDA